MRRFTDRDKTTADPSRRLREASLSLEGQRELVAHWMSDIHAVPDHPALRRLPDGTVFHIDDLTDVLRSLGATSDRGATIIPFARASRPDDDDDPRPGASSMWPTLPPVVIDARAAVRAERRAAAR